MTNFSTTLPQGPEYDSFNMSVYVEIVDDSGGVTTFTIPTPVTVQPVNDSVLSNLLNQIVLSDTNSIANKDLFSGDLRKTSSLMSSLASMLNRKNYNDKKSIEI